MVFPKGHIGFFVGPLAVLAFLILTAAALLAQTGPCTLDNPHSDRNIIANIADACPSGPECLAANRTDQYAVITDIPKKQAARLLVLQLCRLKGMESMQPHELPEANYWQDAWDEALRYIVSKPAWIGLAINPVNGRGQDRLHIHMACVNPPVIDALSKSADQLSARWQTLNVAGVSYNVLKAYTLFEQGGPFSLVPTDDAQAGMGFHTMAVIGKVGGRFYFVLERSTKGESTPQVAENLLEQTCATAQYDAANG